MKNPKNRKGKHLIKNPKIMMKKKKTNGNVIISDDSGAMDSSLWSRLPPEMVDHVLSLLPVKSLCRFKAVSPSWNSRISSPQFARTHLHVTNINTTNKPQKTILASSSGALYSVDLAATNPTAELLDSPFAKWPEVSGSCHGLVLVSDGGNYSDFLWNPFTRECKKLPEYPITWANWSCTLFGVGYDSSTDDYKVVVLIRRCLRLGNKLGVYSLKFDSWRVSQVTDYEYPEASDGFYFNERLHWLSVDTSMTLAAFDMSGEILREIQLPASFDKYRYYNEFNDHHMAVVGGSLSLVLWQDQYYKIEVWMMKKYGVRDSWTKFMISNPTQGIENVLCLSAESEFVLEMNGKIVDSYNQIVDESEGTTLVLYNLEKKTMRIMVVSGIPTKFIIWDHYIETLVCPNHGGQIRRHHEASLGESSKRYQLIGKEHPGSSLAD